MTNPVWIIVIAGSAILMLVAGALRMEDQQRRQDLANQESRPYAVLRGTL